MAPDRTRSDSWLPSSEGAEGQKSRPCGRLFRFGAMPQRHLPPAQFGSRGPPAVPMLTPGPSARDVVTCCDGSARASSLYVGSGDKFPAGEAEMSHSVPVGSG
jgi:hypothetical protein